ncbi:hypothetical protein CEXT_485631 [Caerostris extrusa]|uniref:Uncharacterized protein n=1 Tax=Caerostris extrusa TaxID=172846 RepID=A0AAV4W0B6_CAEEX|nr:hypothetical protein CEXT_485631 [Caerostris extrusa]
MRKFRFFLNRRKFNFGKNKIFWKVLSPGASGSLARICIWKRYHFYAVALGGFCSEEIKSSVNAPSFRILNKRRKFRVFKSQEVQFWQEQNNLLDGSEPWRFLHPVRKKLQVCSNLFSDEHSLCSIKSHPFLSEKAAIFVPNSPNKALSRKEAPNVCLHLASCVFISRTVVRDISLIGP